jgi:hypothetical protein
MQSQTTPLNNSEMPNRENKEKFEFGGRPAIHSLCASNHHLRGNKLFAFAFAASLLMWTVASAFAQNFGTAEEARAMLDRAVAALKSDEARALRELNDADNKEFHDRSLRFLLQYL